MENLPDYIDAKHPLPQESFRFPPEDAISVKEIEFDMKKLFEDNSNLNHVVIVPNFIKGKNG